MADQTSELAQAVEDVTAKAQVLVREEVALAKAEMTEKVTKLVKGAIFGIVAAVFGVFALVYLLHSLAWGVWDIFEIGSDAPWFGFLVVGVLILLLGLIAGVIALRLVKKGSPPTPKMAIQEAQLIKGTLTSSPAGTAVGPVGARQAPAPAPTEGGR